MKKKISTLVLLTFAAFTTVFSQTAVISHDTLYFTHSDCGSETFKQFTIENTGGSDLITNLSIPRSYSYKDSDMPNGPSFHWLDISEIGTNTGLSGDDNSVNVALPFTFTFFGQDKTNVDISTNGYLTFGSIAWQYQNYAIPSVSGWSNPNDIIAPFWDDLYFVENETKNFIYYDAYNDRFIIQYTNQKYYSAEGTVHMQVHLHKNGDISYYYLSIPGTTNSATVGVENSDGTQGLQINYNNNYVHDSMAIHISYEPNWLSLGSYNETISSGTNTAFNVFSKATNKAAGTYIADVIIESNDAINSPDTVACKLTIEGEPEILISGNSFNFGEVYVGNSSVDTLVLFNSGCDTLKITNSLITLSEFTINKSIYKIAPFDSTEIILTFEPSETIEYNGTLTVQNNDETQEISLSGIGVSPPTITLSTNSIEVITDDCIDVNTAELEVGNTGYYDLNYEAIIQVFGFNSSMAGDIIEESTVYGYNGLEIVGDYLYTIQDRNIYVRNLTNGSSSSYYQRYNPYYITYDGNELWFGNSTNLLQSYNLNGNSTGKTVVLPFSNRSPVAWDGNYFVTCNYSQSNPTIYQIDHNSNIITSYPCNIGSTITSLVYVPYHAEGQLWAYAPAIGKIVQLKLDNGQYIINNSFNPPTNFYGYNLAHSGEHLCNVKTNHNFIKVDDGVVESLDYLSLSSSSGTLAMDDSETIELTFSNDQDNTGIYNSQILLTSNDPSNPSKTVACSFIINGHPVLELSKQELVITGINAGENINDTVVIYNTGCDTLFITDYSIIGEAFTTTHTLDTIIPTDSLELVVKFSPTNDEVYYGSITLENNDQDTTINLTGIPGPIIELDRNEITVNTTDCDDSQTEQFTISNTGNDSLFYEIIQQYHGFDENEAGHVIMPADYCHDMRYGTVVVGENIYGVSHYYLRRYDLNSQNYVNIRHLGYTIRSITYDGEYLWIGKYNYLHKYDLNGNHQGTSIRLPFNGYPATTWDGQNFIIANYDQYNPTIYKIDISGNVIESYNSSVGTRLREFTWVQSHGEGQLWANAQDGKIKQLKAIGNSYQVANQFTRPNTAWEYNLSHDGENFYNTNNANYITKFTDGIDEYSWLNTSSVLDTVVEAADSVVEIEFDGTGLNSGVHKIDLLIKSNDLLTPYDTVKCTFNIDGAPEFTTNATSINYQNVFVNATKEDTVVLRNIGCDTLFITNITFSNSAFSVEATSLEVLPQDSAYLGVFFTPSALTAYGGSMTIYSNNVNRNITLEGTGTPSPEMELNVYAIQDTIVDCYDAVVNNYDVINNGDGNLTYTTTVLSSGFNSNTAGTLVEARAVFYANNGHVVVNDMLYGVQSHRLYRNRMSTGYWTNTFAHINARGIVYDDTDLWIGDNKGTLSSYNLNAQATLKTIKAPFSDYMALAFDGTNFIVCDYNQYSPTIFKIDYDGNIIESFSPIAINTSLSSFTWVEKHADGKLWAAGANGKIMQLNLSNGSYSIVNQFNKPSDFYPNSLSHDGVNLTSCASGPLNIFHDGIIEANTWVNISSFDGIINANDTTVVEAEFDSQNLHDGNYEAWILVNSNDPLNPIDTIVCELVVDGQPEMVYSSSELQFGSVYTNVIKTLTLKINNTGCDTLKLSELSIPNNSFSLSHASAVILPEDSLDIDVNFAPTRAGNYNSVLSILSNDYNFDVEIWAQAEDAPVMVIEADTIRTTITECFTTIEEELRIRNTGDGELEYSFNDLALEYNTNNSGVIANYSGKYSYYGLVWVNDYLYTLNGKVYKFDQNLNLVSSFNVRSGVSSIVHDGTYFYVGDNTGKLFRYDENGNEIGSFIQLPYSSYSNLTFDGENILAAQRTSNPTVYKINSDGDVVDSFSLYSNNRSVYGLAWASKHKGKELWALTSSYNYARQYAFDENDNRYEEVLSIYTGYRAYHDGLTYYNNELWQGTNSNRVLHINDGYAEPSQWLNLPEPEIIDGNLSRLLDIEFDASNLNNGVYKGELVINSNDPLNPSDTVYLELTVDGEPAITTSFDTYDFGNEWILNDGDKNLSIENSGCDTLVVDSIIIDLDDYTVNIQNFELLPGDNQNVNINFTALDKGERNATLTIYSNTAQKTVELSGFGLVSEVTSMSANPSHTYLNEGDFVQMYVNFNNTVNVNTSTGTPRIELNTDPTMYANYFSGSGSNTLEFRYYVGADENSDDLDYTNVNALELNGGTITYQGILAELELPSVGYLNLHLVIDNTDPILGISTDNIHFNAAGAPKQITIESEETIYNFLSTDILVTNGSVASITPNGIASSTYTVNINPAGSEGDITISIPTNAGNDIAGNPTVSPEAFVLDYDLTSPTPVLTQPDADLTNDNPMTVTVTFDEPITGLNASHFVIGNGSASNVKSIGNGDVYTVNVYPAADGQVTINLPGSATIKDLAGNSSNAAAQITRTFDGDKPTVILSSRANDPTDVNPIVVDIKFDEEIKGLSASDFVVSNGSAINVVTINDGLTYTVDILSINAGEVSVTLPANSVADLAKNGNIASNKFSIQSTSVSPTAVITSNSGSYSNTSPVNATIQFSESITGFTLSDLNISGATASNLTTVTAGTTFSFDLTPKSEGAVSVTLPDNKTNSASGNANVKSNTMSVIYDATKPNAELSSTTTAVTNSSSVSATVKFNEPVTGFVLADITSTNATISNLTEVVSGKVFTIDIAPTTDGIVTVDIASAVAVDLSGNSNTAASQLSFTSDKTNPTVAISSVYSGITNKNPMQVSIVFSEVVSGFTKTDVKIQNGIAGTLSEVKSGKEYSLNIIPTENGNVSIDIAGASATDAASNNNTAATQHIVAFDNASPTLSITSNISAITNSNLATVSFNFSENVSGFDITDLSVTNGTLSNFAESTKGTSYSVDITPTEYGEVQLTIAKNGLTDNAGNTNKTNAYYSFMYDNSAPSVIITSTSSSLTNDTPITTTISFDELVSGFDISDITATNALLANFTTVTEGEKYTIEISPEAEGEVTVNVAADAVLDVAGNTNTATTYSRTYDETAPVASIATTTSSPISSGIIDVTINFDEKVIAFNENFVYTGNGTSSNFTEVSEGLEYKLNVTPDDDGDVVIYVANGVTTDAAGNGNIGSSSISINYDATAPVITDITLNEVTPFTAEFTVVANENGTVYYQVLEPITTVPSASEVMSSSNDSIITSGSISLNAAAETDLNLTDLDSKTRYALYFVTEDGLGNTSTVMKTNFETDKYVDVAQLLEQSIDLFPNPNNGKFQIDFGKADITDGKMEIRSLAGALISEIEIVSKTQTIDLGTREQGVYIIQMHLQNTIINKRLVIE